MPAQQMNYLERFLDPVISLLTPAALERMVNFRFDSTVQARAAELAEKANEALLTDEERAEYAEYIEVVDLIAIFQSSARRVGN